MKRYNSFNEMADGICASVPQEQSDDNSFNEGGAAIDNMSPTIQIDDDDGFTFDFWSNEPNRMNIHVKKDGKEAVFWVESKGVFSDETVELKKKNSKFPDHHVNKAKKKIIEKLPVIRQQLQEFEKRKEDRK